MGGVNQPQDILTRMQEQARQLEVLRRQVTALSPGVSCSILPADAIVNPTTTVSGTAVWMERIHCRKQRSRLWVKLAYKVPAGSTGEMSLQTSDLVAVVNPIVVTEGAGYFEVDGVLPGPNGGLVDVDLVWRLASGVGPVGIRIALAEC